MVKNSKVKKATYKILSYFPKWLVAIIFGLLTVVLQIAIILFFELHPSNPPALALYLIIVLPPILFIFIPDLFLNKRAKYNYVITPIALVTWIIVAGIIAIHFNLFMAVPGHDDEILSQCIAGGSVSCLNFIYNHSTGDLTLTLQQNTGMNWYNTKFSPITQNTTYSNGIPQALWGSANVVTINGVIPSGSKFNVTLPISGPVSNGTSISLILLGRYQTNGSKAFNYTEIQITAPAT